VKALALAERPFYAERLDGRGRPEPWTLDELEDFAAAHQDPYGGRRLPGATPPAVSLQIETADEPPLWLGLDARELSAWAGVLTAAWSRWGVSPGECVALFDYGSSPVVLLASASYAPHLRRGAAERLGATVVCNDGVAVAADRMLDVIEQLVPAALVLRRDVLAPLASVFETAGVTLAGSCRWVAVTEAEGAPHSREVERLQESWGVPVHRIARVDAAHLLAGDCRRCGAFHLSPRHYAVEPTGRDGLAVTARFARTCASVRHHLEGATRLPGSCPDDPRALRICWP
jgi:hypothetical protein